MDNVYSLINVFEQISHSIELFPVRINSGVHDGCALEDIMFTSLIIYIMSPYRY